MTRLYAIILLLAILMPAAGNAETPTPPVKILDLTVESIEGNQMTVHVTYHQLKEKYRYIQNQTTDFVTFLVLNAAGNVLEKKNVIFPENRSKDELGNPVIYNSNVLLPAPAGMSRVEIRFGGERLFSADVPQGAAPHAAPYLEIKQNPLRQFDSRGGYLRFDVSTNLPAWDISTPDWCAVADRATGQFTLKADANRTGSERKGMVRISSGGLEAETEITQPSEPVSPGKALINKVKIKKNAISDNQKGIEVRIKADLMNMKGRQTVFSAMLKGNGETICTEVVYHTPESDYETADQHVFIPFDDFDSEMLRRKQYWVNILILDASPHITEPQLIGRMDFNYIK